MLTRLLSLALLIVPSFVQAQSQYQDPTTKLLFPPTLSAFEQTKVRRFDDPRLGVQISYTAPGLGKADIYLFDLGHTQIPEGIESDVVRSAYASADSDVKHLVETGRYVDFEQLIPLGAVMRPADQPLQWFVATYRFRIKDGDSGPLVSWLLVSGYRNQFLKIRFTHLASKSKEGRVALDGLLEAFWRVNKPEKPLNPLPNPRSDI